MVEHMKIAQYFAAERKKKYYKKASAIKKGAGFFSAKWQDQHI